MKRAFQLSITLALAAFLVLPMPGHTSSLDRRMDVVKAKIRQKTAKEGVLTTTITSYNHKIQSLQGEIRGLQDRQNRIQVSLDAKRAELFATQNKLEKAKDRLARLKVYLAQAQKVLAQRLVQMYKDGEPDALTVVLESNGFADLLERTQFLDRITNQDDQIITRVRRLKAETTHQTNELAALQKQQKAAAIAIEARRNQVAAVKGKLVSSRTDLQSARDGRQVILSRVRSTRHRLEGDLSKMQAQVAAQLRAAQAQAAGPSVGAGPIRHGSGSLIWPVNGPITSPFCERRAWEACHPGIDIGVPAGTPIRAADSGRVVIAGWVGGYGNYTCIQHTASLSTCYGHQSVIKVSVGQNVSQGQVIGLSGCTGLCFGDHLHFEVRINGAVTNPLNYL
ncbi:MAG TPA: peptidoglycan DD-metalloendopeptidase family protein [Thermoleophilaceae bacterium]|nr:peptidoglycan DD-metalloendopeptidase family protein [Thermoleophilaceae bacterium]